MLSRGRDLDNELQLPETTMPESKNHQIPVRGLVPARSLAWQHEALKELKENGLVRWGNTKRPIQLAIRRHDLC
jgi:hypothetical protein